VLRKKEHDGLFVKAYACKRYHSKRRACLRIGTPNAHQPPFPIKRYFTFLLYIVSWLKLSSHSVCGLLCNQKTGSDGEKSKTHLIPFQPTLFESDREGVLQAPLLRVQLVKR